MSPVITDLAHLICVAVAVQARKWDWGGATRRSGQAHDLNTWYFAADDDRVTPNKDTRTKNSLKFSLTVAATAIMGSSARRSLRAAARQA
jgi:hypothetical protein